MLQGRTIFLVEDNDADAELALRAFQRANATIIRVKDGLDALDYLFGRGAYAERDTRDLPLVALLDINLPKISGLQLLKLIREDERTRYLPVVILTSSNEEQDRLRAYEHNANSYVLKPVDYDKFLNAALQLSSYWTKLNTPPPRQEA